jgi:PAS domain S-box-containing protein
MFFIVIVLLIYELRRRKSVEKLLRESEGRFRLLYDDAPVMMHSTNEEGYLITVNKQWLKTMGYKLDEVIGHKSTDFLTEVSRIYAKETVFPEFLKTGSCDNISYQFVTKNNQIIDVRLSASSDSDDAQKTITSHAVLLDETRKLQIENQLRRSQKMDALGKLTGGIAHDYNNMLGVILGYSELLKNFLKDDPKLLKYVDHISHAGERGAKLTKKLLGFSRGKHTQNKIININKLLLDELNMLEKLLTARIKINFDLSDDIWNINLDEGDLEDAIINLSINAMHAIENNGVLEFKTRNVQFNKTDAALLGLIPGDYILLSITDTGCGMGEAETEKIFEPFYSTKGEKGTGLGLTQVYGFIKRSNGAIEISSELAHGTSLSLYFPSYVGSQSEIEEAIIYSEVPFKGNETILVVDDEPALLNLTVEILRQQNYRVFIAKNGEQALDILANETIDLMLSDVIMPEMDGYQLAAIVKEKYPITKIQMVSGYTGEVEASMVVAKNDNLLVKPFDSQTLLQRLRLLLSS